MKLAQRTETITPSYTIGISTRVTELREQGKHIVNFSAGEPDFDVPEKAKKCAMKALEDNRTKYDRVPGLVDLRREIAEKLKTENQVEYELDEIVVTNGAKQAITNTLNAILDPGEEVLISIPYWVSYPEIVKLCGGVPVFVLPEDQVRYKVTAKDLEKHITSKTKILFFNNPSNPAGTLYNREEVKEIAELCLRHQLYILSDEIYERFCFDGEYTSVSSLSPETKEITILVNGLSKAAAMTGLRIGYTASSQKVAKAIAALQGHLTSHPATISQWAGVGALSSCKEEINGQLSVYRERRDIAMEILDGMEKISYLRPGGAFYIFINISGYREYFSKENAFSIQFCERLLNDAGVACVPGIAFGLDDYMRISYALDTESLVEGLEKIRKFLEGLKK